MQTATFLILTIAVLGIHSVPNRSGKIIDGKIIGGDVISLKDAPYQVALLYFGRLMCGGSILSPKFVLTAAHCTYTVNTLTYLLIRVGYSLNESNGTIHEISRITNHPNFDSGLLDNDVAVITLMTKIEFNEYAQPIELPYLYEPIPEGRRVKTSGYGKTENGTNSPVLRMVELKIVNQLACSKVYDGISTKMVCASATGKDTCNGDSGGPLVDLTTNKLVGIVSFGSIAGCALPGYPGVYTRIASLRTWIKQIINF